MRLHLRFASTFQALPSPKPLLPYPPLKSPSNLSNQLQKLRQPRAPLFLITILRNLNFPAALLLPRMVQGSSFSLGRALRNTPLSQYLLPAKTEMQRFLFQDLHRLRKEKDVHQSPQNLDI